MKKIFILFIALSTMMGCTRQIDPSIVNNANGELTKGVYAKIADFFPVGFSTKSTLIQEGESAPIFSWSDGDVIGVIPNNGKTIQTNYEISDIMIEYTSSSDFALSSDLIAFSNSVIIALWESKVSHNSFLISVVILHRLIVCIQ